MISFCGVVVPYDAMQPFWRYWMYYLDPFTYLVGGLLTEVLWDVKVQCNPSEYLQFSAPAGQSCGDYMSDFLSANPGYLLDANATGTCSFCEYSTGADYAKTFNKLERYYGWRDVSYLSLFLYTRVLMDIDWYYGTVLHHVVHACVCHDEAAIEEDQGSSIGVRCRPFKECKYT